MPLNTISYNAIISAVCGKKKREKPKTLNGRLPLEDSSDFDDPVLVLIVMMRSIV